MTFIFGFYYSVIFDRAEALLWVLLLSVLSTV